MNGSSVELFHSLTQQTVATYTVNVSLWIIHSSAFVILNLVMFRWLFTLYFAKYQTISVDVYICTHSFPLITR